MDPKKCRACRSEPRAYGKSRCKKCQDKVDREKRKAKEERAKIRRKEKLETKRNGVQYLSERAHLFFSPYIRIRDKGKPCVTCGRPWTENAECGHFMSRRFHNTAWDERNAHGQCTYCNKYHNGEQEEHRRAVDLIHGAGTADELWRKAHDPNFRNTPEFIKEQIVKYEAKLAELGYRLEGKKAVPIVS